MNGKRTLCFIGAHPDDETFGLGSTLAHFDLASLAEVDFPIHAVVSPTKAAVRARNEAMSCYASQRRSGPPQRNLLFLVRRFLG